MSSINVFATQEDITKVEDKITAVSGSEIINLTLPDRTTGIYEQFCIDNDLYDTEYVKNLKTIVNSSATNYYTDINTAVTDLNAGTTEHSTSSSAGAICEIFSNDSGITVLRLLQSITSESIIVITHPCVLDLYGNQLTLTKLGECVFFATLTEAIVYGVKSGSQMTLTPQGTQTYQAANLIVFNMSQSAIVIGVDFVSNCNEATVNNLQSIYSTVTSNSNSLLALYGCNLTIYNTKATVSGVTTGSPPVISCYRQSSDRIQTLVIDNCNITVNSNQVNCTNITANTYGCTIIKNSNIIRNGCTLNDVTDGILATIHVGSTVPSGSKQFSVIDNCTVIAENYAVGADSNTFITNCILKGKGHGGIYMTTYIEGNYDLYPCYIKDTEMYLREPHVNAYSCYIGSGSIKFDNCKFTSETGQYNRPALKHNNGTFTKAYFSNCQLDSIRVDATCYAYMGLGIPDSVKQTTVSGEIIDTGSTTYCFNIIEEQIKDKFFYCTYGTTTYAEIQAAVNAGKIPVCVYNQGSYTGGVYNFFGMTSSACYFTKMYSTTNYYILVNTSNTWSNSSTVMEAPYQSKYNNRRTVGANELGRTLICAEDKDGRITPMVLGNTTAATKTACTVPFRPQSIYYFSGTSAMSAGALMNTATLFESIYTTSCLYTFNGSMPAYSTAYLIGTYNKTTGLFTLDSTSTTSYYVFVPNNTASITLSSYFTTGKYYIRIGSSTSSANQLQIEMHKPMYYFDGTNLVDGYTAGGVTDVQINGTSIVENGVASIPIASPTQLGLVKPAGSSYGIAYQTSGNICTASATNSDIEVRTNEYKPITPSNLKYAVDSVLCSTSASEALTSQQKANAKARLGISDSEKFELIEEVSIVSGITEIDKYTEPDGTAYNFKAVRIYLNGVTPDSTEYNRIMYMRLFNGDNDIIGGAYHDTWNSRPHGILDVYDKHGFWESELHTNSSATAWNSTYALPTLNMRMMEVNNNYIKHINFKAATDGSSFASGTIKIYAIRA